MKNIACENEECQNKIAENDREIERLKTLVQKEIREVGIW